MENYQEQAMRTLGFAYQIVDGKEDVFKEGRVVADGLIFPPYTSAGSLCPSFLPARHVCLPVKRPYAIALYKAGYQSARGHLWKPPLRFWRRPPQSNYPPSSVRANCALDLRQPKGRISRMAPRMLAHPLRSLRPILHIG